MTVCVACAEPANFAAVALKLQSTALHAERCIYERQRKLRSATNQPTHVTMSSAPLAGLAAGVHSLGSLLPGTTLFANSSLRVNGFPPPGVYEVGCALQATASGAVTDNSIRALNVASKLVSAPLDAPFLYAAAETVRDPNNGNGVDMNLSATIVIQDRQIFAFAFYHENAASTITIAAGAIFWMTRLSDQIATAVV